jgi:DNA-binding MarR family transcriptional regulator
MAGVARKKGGAPTDEDYRSLAEWRYALRRFLAASEKITRSAGVSPTQYQLLLFVRGDPGRAPAIADLAERLQIRHQSAVGLVDRCEAAGLVRRRRDETNRRRVFVTMTPRGASLLERLAAEHFATIESLGRSFEPPLRAASRRKTGHPAVSARAKRRS